MAKQYKIERNNTNPKIDYLIKRFDIKRLALRAFILTKLFYYKL